MKQSQQFRFETHLTLLIEEDASLNIARDWAIAKNLKWSDIILDKGDTPSQPMVTFRGQGTLEEQIRIAKSLVLELSAMGVQVARVKVEFELPFAETQIELPLIPVPENQYFEHHVKLLLSPNINLAQLSSFVNRYGGYLSRNARRQRADGMQERFVTQRVYGTDPAKSYRHFAQLTDAIRKADFEIVESEHEFVLYDTNIELDSGWMEMQ